MMTVKELINWLEDFDEDAEVVIGMIQSRGMDFAMNIEEISTETVDDWDNGKHKMVVITEGNQIGSVCYKYGDEYDEYDEDEEEEDY